MHDSMTLILEQNRLIVVDRFNVAVACIPKPRQRVEGGYYNSI